MKLVRYGPVGLEKPGIVDAAGNVRDLAGIVPDIAGAVLSAAGLAELARLDIGALPLVSGNFRLGPCVGGTRHFIAIGLNYFDHAVEAKMEIPKEPIIFQKAPSCISRPNDDVVLPPGSEKSDWELELAIVIGSRAQYLSKAAAMDAVAGFCICNDVSERHYQLERGGQWAKGKGCATFGPLGPWLVTKDEIPDVQQLDMWLTVNDVGKQNSSTQKMIFDAAHLVSYCSQFFVLEPGDVITTGTPSGVGLGMKPEPQFLRAGDVMRLGIAGLGVQQQRVVNYQP